MSILHDQKTKAPGWKRVVAGSLCGVMGAVSCNPFELVKTRYFLLTRLQSAAVGDLAVGHQHNYTGVWQALKSIYTQDGIKGLYRGSLLSMSRSIVGSGANLASFSMMKETLMEKGWKDNALLDMVCGLSSGIVSCLFMNPIDVVRTRYYNQPYTNGSGALYSSGVDAIKKIWTMEGPSAFYKGFVTHFLRIGPHFCLTFVFLGMLRRSTTNAYDYLDRKESFQVLDVNHDGKLDLGEIENALKKILPEKSDPLQIHEYAERILSGSPDNVITTENYQEMLCEVMKIYKEQQIRSPDQ